MCDFLHLSECFFCKFIRLHLHDTACKNYASDTTYLMEESQWKNLQHSGQYFILEMNSISQSVDIKNTQVNYVMNSFTLASKHYKIIDKTMNAAIAGGSTSCGTDHFTTKNNALNSPCISVHTYPQSYASRETELLLRSRFALQ